MKTLIFATHNSNKLEEASLLLGHSVKVLGLDHLGHSDEIIEDGKTLEENAIIKAQCIHNKYKLDCFSDDTGLEVEALNNEPGVLSARYAGQDKNSEANIDKLLYNLRDEDNRKAHFVTIVALINQERQYIFRGQIEGRITKSRRGKSGFGYDAVFMPKSFGITFAEMSIWQKNAVSHRFLALNQLKAHINNQK